MIHESVPWKTALTTDAAVIERWAAKPPSERRSFLLERKVFLAAYALRKLGEAYKLSTDTLAASIAVKRYAPLQPGYSAFNNHRFDKFFDLQAATAVEMPRRRLLDVLIHSLVFIEAVDEDDHCAGFLVTSDYEASRGLFEIQLTDFVALMRQAAEDFPTALRRSFDADKGRWVVWTGHAPEIAQALAEAMAGASAAKGSGS
jgi:hypothetical protein